MRTPIFMMTLAAALCAAPVVAQTPADPPVYVASSQYSAVLHQTRGLWQLLPAEGATLLVGADDCHSARRLPVGLWLLTRDAQGRPELVAPSATALPRGAADHVALRRCDVAGKTDLAVPQPMIDLLVAGTGAVYVAD